MKKIIISLMISLSLIFTSYGSNTNFRDGFYTTFYQYIINNGGQNTLNSINCVCSNAFIGLMTDYGNNREHIITYTGAYWKNFVNNCIITGTYKEFLYDWMKRNNQTLTWLYSMDALKQLVGEINNG